MLSNLWDEFSFNNVLLVNIKIILECILKSENENVLMSAFNDDN